MKKRNCEIFFSFNFFLILIFLISINEIKSIDLTKQNPVEKKIYFKGKIGLNHYYEPITDRKYLEKNVLDYEKQVRSI